AINYSARECLSTVVDNMISGIRVVRDQHCFAEWHGSYSIVVSDNGIELSRTPPTSGRKIDALTGPKSQLSIQCEPPSLKGSMADYLVSV
ncbi:MAG: hypothetical protein ABJQ63_10115, partial [Lentilitoribacter sp.]